MRRHAIAVILLVLAGVGVWGGIDLTIVHYKLLTDTDYVPPCDVEDTLFSCSEVSLSRWSEHALPLFDHPVPTSIFPVGFFTGFAVLVLLGWWRRGNENYTTERARDDTLAFAWLLLLPALVVDLLLIYVMKFQIRAWCLVCLTIDGATLGLLLSTPFARTRGWRGLFSGGLAGIFRHGNWLAFGAAFCLMVLVAQGRYGNGMERFQTETRLEFVAQFQEVEPEDMPLLDGEPRRGTPGAPFTVVEYADFQCPYCADCSHDIGRLIDAYPGQIEFVFRHYPLGQDCAPGLQRDSHPQACMAAYATDCAGQHGKFWEMYDVLFELYPQQRRDGKAPTLEDVRAAAHELGLPAAAFYYCLEDEDIKQGVIDSVLLGRQFGVRGTPAVFVNGVLLPGGANAPMFLEWLIRAHLERQVQPLDDPILY